MSTFRPLSRQRHALPADTDVMCDPLGWYETWRAQRDGRAAAEAAMQRQLKRQITWISWFIVGWTALICSATLWVIRTVI